MRKASLKAAVMALAVPALTGVALAQAYPQRTITLVAATSAGGPGDGAARLVAERMSATLGQQILVENIAGAGGLTGAQRVARAEPDGYTLLVHQTGISILSTLAAGSGLNVEKELTAVGLINTSHLILTGRKSLPPNSFADLAAWMKEPGRRVRIGHPGTGTIGHLALLVFSRAVGVEVDAVPYRGLAPVLNDMLGDHVDLTWAASFNSAPLIKEAKLKGYVVGAPKRSSLVPDIPSAPEVRLPELDMPLWHALFAPTATPRPVVETLNAALRKALGEPAVVKSFAATGVEAFPDNMLTPQAADAFVKSEVARWSSVVASATQK